MGKGELRVKPPPDAVMFESTCDCVYPVAVVKTSLAPHEILPVLSIVHTTEASGFFINKGLVVPGVAIVKGVHVTPLLLTDTL